MQIKEPNPVEFAESIARRSMGTAKQSMAQLATTLRDYYAQLDKPARESFVDQAVRMYANYENRWLGEVKGGSWVDQTPQGSNNVYFTVPLLTAHVDSHTTFYCKTRPKYIAKPFVNTYLSKRLAEMCQEIASAELQRMMTYPQLQKESQNICLATVSYRNIVMDTIPQSPLITERYDEDVETEIGNYACADCGTEFQSEGPASQCPNEACMSPNIVAGETEAVTKTVEQQRQVPLPRPMIVIPNPIAIQDDFSAATFKDSSFVISRRKISRREAEYYYQIDLSNSYDTSQQESNTQYSEARKPLGSEKTGWVPRDFPQYTNYLNQQVEEVKMYLKPCEYGLYFVDGELLQTVFPHGAMFHIVGDILVNVRPCRKELEWVRVQQGMRPLSNKGVGQTHLADLNDAVNNAISLEFSILRTHGFPMRLIRGKWLSALPQANQTLVMEKIPDDRDLREAIHTEQASNTSGLLGIITQKFMGFMQYIGGSLNPVGMPTDAKDFMGSATAAASYQEMMTDRMGLSLQMRVEADIDTMYAVLELLRDDDRNRQYFIDGGYDETVVNAFFSSDFRSSFFFEPVRGTDEPRIDSVNTFKVQSFAGMAAQLTGLRQFDPDTFYDIVAALGETLNIDVSVGAGRSERNLAENRINRVIELYRDEKDTPELNEMTAVDLGNKMYQAVMMKESLLIKSLVMSKMPPPEAGLGQEEMMEIAGQIEQNLVLQMYDYDALAESYSDWMQSDAGQNADIPVQTAIGLLYSDCRDRLETLKQIQQAEAMQMALLTGGIKPPSPGQDADDKKADNPPGPLKRDGSSGPGRPRDVKVDKPPE